LAFSSGLAAISTLSSILKNGAHVVSINDVYGGTNRYFAKIAVKNQIETEFVDLLDAETLGKHLKPHTEVLNGTKNAGRERRFH
jgi:cystathionine gamma-lyase